MQGPLCTAIRHDEGNCGQQGMVGRDRSDETYVSCSFAQGYGIVGLWDEGHVQAPSDFTMDIGCLNKCYTVTTMTLTSVMEKRISAFEMKCYRKVLRIPWTEKRTNAEIRKNLHIEEDWLLTNIKHRKLTYFGHIKRHNGLERIILEGQVPGKRKRGRPRRRWTQDVLDLLHM
ncbi:hypothetical protein BsWGS_08056 [Bradybaena similaris]